MVVDGQLFIRTGEMELALNPRTLTPSTDENADSPQVNEEIDEISASNQGSLSYAAYHILTAADPLEKVLKRTFLSLHCLCTF